MARKSNKRGQNEGSIRKVEKTRKDGTKYILWEARYSLGFDEDGKHIRKSISGKTREDVAKRLTEALNSIATGTYIEPSKMILSAWLDTWLREYKQNNVKGSTLGVYERLITVNVNPSIGNILLKDLRPDTMQKFYNTLNSKNGRVNKKGALSTASIRKIHNILHGAIAQAVKNGLMQRNVTEGATLPRHTQKEVRALSREEQALFIKSADGERLKFAFIFALGTGLRRGELLGLAWKNVDIENGIIYVKQQIQRIMTPYEDTKTKIIISSVKSKSGNRSIPIPQNLLTQLKAHKASQLQERLKAGTAWTESNLVFTNEIGCYIEPSHICAVFKRVIDKAGLKGFSIHCCRHTYATRLLENNVSPKIAQELLGHSKISQTLDCYAHVLPETKKEAVQVLNAMF